MSFEKDFEHIWISSEAFLYKALIDVADRNIFDAVNEAWQHEKLKWRNSGQVQCAFLKSLSRQNPSCAEEFLETFEKFSFKKIDLPTPGFAPYVFGTLCFAATGAGIGYFLPSDSFLPKFIGDIPTIIFGGVFFAWIGGGVFLRLRRNKANTLRDLSANAYIEQMKPLQQVLSGLCKKGDVVQYER